MTTPEYGSYDGYAVCWTDDEAWILVDGTWRRTEPVFVRIKAARARLNKLP